MSLMTFVLNTLQPRVNDPTNSRLWLPRLLAGMTNGDGSLVLPIHATDQNLGAITGDSGASVASYFATTYQTWMSGVEGKTIEAEPDPASPYPILAFPKLTIAGLQNISVQLASATATASGYDVELYLIFDTYPDPTQGIAMQPLSLVGDYNIQQALLWRPEGATDWSSDNLVGTGSVSLALSQCQMVAQATIGVNGAGPARTNSIVVTSLALVGTQAGAPPGVTVDNLTVDGDFKGAKEGLISLVTEMLESNDAAAALTQAVGTLLMAPSNLASVNDLVGGRAGGVLDGILGPVPASGLPDDGPNQKAATPVDLYLFDRIRLALAAPDSDWFLPLQLASSDDPVIEPYSNPSIDVPDQTIKGLNYTNIKLTNVVLAGASNASMPPAATSLDIGKIGTVVTLGILPAGTPRQLPRSGGPVTMPVPPAPPVLFTAGFSLVQQGLKPVPLQGTLTARITGATAALTITPTGSSVDDLQIGLSHATASLAGATITVSVQLNPPNDGLQQIINALFAQPAVQQQVLVALNDALAGQASAISDQLSQIARTAILTQLQG